MKTLKRKDLKGWSKKDLKAELVKAAVWEQRVQAWHNEARAAEEVAEDEAEEARAAATELADRLEQHAAKLNEASVHYGLLRDQREAQRQTIATHQRRYTAIERGLVAFAEVIRSGEEAGPAPDYREGLGV